MSEWIKFQNGSIFRCIGSYNYDNLVGSKEAEQSLRNVIAYIEDVIAQYGNDITDQPLECAAANLLDAYRAEKERRESAERVIDEIKHGIHWSVVVDKASQHLAKYPKEADNG